MSEQVKPKFLWFRISIFFGLLLGLLLLVQTVATYRYVSQNLVRQEAQREADRRMQSIARAARLTGSRDPAALAPVLKEMVHESPQQIAWIRILNMDGKILAESDKVPEAQSYKPGELGKLLEDRNRRPAQRNTKFGEVLVVVNPMRFGGPPVFNAPPPDRGPQGPENRPASPAVQPSPTATVPAPALQQAPPAPTQEQAAQPPAAPRPEQGPGPGAEPEGRGRGGRGRNGGGRGAPELAEIAFYFDGLSANFLPLRANLIVGCAASFALMASLIIIGLRFRHYMRGKHIEEELSLARRVQLDLFPAENSVASNLAFAARCVPAYQVGGDLYDVFETDEGQVGLVLGDVSGKGLPAALLMGVVQGAVRASQTTGAPAHHEQAAERLNHLLCMKTARERFVSLFWCYFDQHDSALRYINAGHLPPLLIRQQGDKQVVERLDSGGPVLGLLPGVRYTQAAVPVQPGDLLVVFSDGILEAANSLDQEFGEEGVLASVKRHWKLPPGELCTAILEDVRTFLGKELPQDDQTLMVVSLDSVSAALDQTGNMKTAVTGS